MKKVALFLGLIYITSLQASDWKVVRLKGKVYADGNLIAKNALLKEGSIIETGEKSFVKIRYEGQNTIVVAPKSTVTLTNIAKGKTKIISLLKGQMRASLKRKREKDYKLKVKTRFAALGVRGTDFHVTYNDQNKITSTISYEGVVDLTSPELDRPSIVMEGYVASASIDKLNLNTKLSPRQFLALKRNSDLDFSKKKKKHLQTKSKKAIGAIPKMNDIYEKDQGLVPIPRDLLGDDYENIELDGPAFKGGGYIDLNTGIYIAPPENSKYDKNNDVYIPPKGFGDIDPETGGYIPPFGLILHPINGFILVSEKIEKTIQATRKFVTDAGETVLGTTKDIVVGAKNKLVSSTGVVGECHGKGSNNHCEYNT